MSEQEIIQTNTGRRSWREIWQVPTLAAAVLLLLGGLIGVVMTKPQPDIDGYIRQASSQIERGEYTDAIGVLNQKVRPHVDAPFFTEDHREQFHVLRGRAIGRAERELINGQVANHESVLAEFASAEQAGATLGGEDQILRVEALIATGKFDEAKDRIDRLPEEVVGERIGLRKLLIEQVLAERFPKYEFAEELLIELTQDPLLGVGDRCWATARRAEIQLERGYTDEAITGLLREMPRVAAADESARGELFTLLGRAYMETGAISEARKQLERAAELIEDGTDLYAQTLLALGNAYEKTDEMELALNQFDLVTQDYASSKAYLPSLLGRGNVMSAIAETDPALVSMEEAVQSYVRFVEEAKGEASQSLLEEGSRSLLRRCEEQFIRDELVIAAQYAQLAEDLWGLDQAPIEVLETQARVNLAMATDMLEGAVQGEDHVIDLADADPVTRAQTQRYFIRAADYYRRHADAIAGGDDDASYAGSLWNAADAYDRGGDSAEAIAGFIEFAATISDDPRVPEAQFRLARAYQAGGEYALAAEQFEDLLNASHDAEQGRHVGPYAVLSYVPLAQVYLSDGDESNDERAEELLGVVIRGEIGDVDSEAFASALAALGQVYYLKGEYPRAIESLTEAVARGVGSREVHRLKFLLGDARRLEADSIMNTLTQGSVAPSVARELADKRREHLQRAAILYAEARDGLESVDSRRRTVLEELYLRNSYFYIGDCAFDLGEYESAIRSYSIAKDRYSNEAASLVAMVQIFNSYFERGDLERARTASERARRFYESLPEGAWEDTSLPMSRADWERWLDSSYELAVIRSEDMDG
ncbi:MAG: tetratricopeptide repeat protein [Phycisphaerales bacterium JB058]